MSPHTRQLRIALIVACVLVGLAFPTGNFWLIAAAALIFGSVVGLMQTDHKRRHQSTSKRA